MHTFQKEFIEFAISLDALRFGSFQLKSGRISPYFFNAGVFSTSSALVRLGNFYARALQSSGHQFDGLFGPAYKGIPLATALGMSLFSESNGQIDLPVTFNRKEIKAHGEGGTLVGATLSGRILMVDDVITAGTAIRESIGIIRAAGATPAGVLVALDRQETVSDTPGSPSAIASVVAEFDMPVIPIITMQQIFEYLNTDEALASHREKMESYRLRYGAVAAA